MTASLSRPVLDQSFERMTADSHFGAMLDNFVASRPSTAERRAEGKALRGKVSRQAHAQFAPDANRADPVEILETQNRTRVEKLVPVRYARMLASPFAFLRGSAAVMTADLAALPTTGVFVNACGDMHVSNFGVFGSAERELIFAINDFDEVFPAPWEWDVKRLAASAAVAVRFMGGGRWRQPRRLPKQCVPIAAMWRAMPRWVTWRSGTTGSTSVPFWMPCHPMPGAAPSASSTRPVLRAISVFWTN